MAFNVLHQDPPHQDKHREFEDHLGTIRDILGISIDDQKDFTTWRSPDNNVRASAPTANVCNKSQQSGKIRVGGEDGRDNDNIKEGGGATTALLPPFRKLGRRGSCPSLDSHSKEDDQRPIRHPVSSPSPPPVLEPSPSVSPLLPSPPPLTRSTRHSTIPLPPIRVASNTTVTGKSTTKKKYDKTQAAVQQKNPHPLPKPDRSTTPILRVEDLGVELRRQQRRATTGVVDDNLQTFLAKIRLDHPDRYCNTTVADRNRANVCGPNEDEGVPDDDEINDEGFRVDLKACAWVPPPPPPPPPPTPPQRPSPLPRNIYDLSEEHDYPLQPGIFDAPVRTHNNVANEKKKKETNDGVGGDIQHAEESSRHRRQQTPRRASLRYQNDSPFARSAPDLSTKLNDNENGNDATATSVDVANCIANQRGFPPLLVQPISIGEVERRGSGVAKRTNTGDIMPNTPRATNDGVGGDIHHADESSSTRYQQMLRRSSHVEESTRHRRQQTTRRSSLGDQNDLSFGHSAPDLSTKLNDTSAMRRALRIIRDVDLLMSEPNLMSPAHEVRCGTTLPSPGSQSPGSKLLNKLRRPPTPPRSSLRDRIHSSFESSAPDLSVKSNGASAKRASSDIADVDVSVLLPPPKDAPGVKPSDKLRSPRSPGRFSRQDSKKSFLESSSPDPFVNSNGASTYVRRASRDSSIPREDFTVSDPYCGLPANLHRPPASRRLSRRDSRGSSFERSPPELSPKPNGGSGRRTSRNVADADLPASDPIDVSKLTRYLDLHGRAGMSGGDKQDCRGKGGDKDDNANQHDVEGRKCEPPANVVVRIESAEVEWHCEPPARLASIGTEETSETQTSTTIDNDDGGRQKCYHELNSEANKLKQVIDDFSHFLSQREDFAIETGLTTCISSSISNNTDKAQFLYFDDDKSKLEGITEVPTVVHLSTPKVISINEPKSLRRHKKKNEPTRQKKEKGRRHSADRNHKTLSKKGVTKCRKEADRKKSKFESDFEETFGLKVRHLADNDAGVSDPKQWTKPRFASAFRRRSAEFFESRNKLCPSKSPFVPDEAKPPRQPTVSEFKCHTKAHPSDATDDCQGVRHKLRRGSVAKNACLRIDTANNGARQTAKLLEPQHKFSRRRSLDLDYELKSELLRSRSQDFKSNPFAYF